jgi:hypothetical protein
MKFFYMYIFNTIIQLVLHNCSALSMMIDKVSLSMLKN